MKCKTDRRREVVHLVVENDSGFGDHDSVSEVEVDRRGKTDRT